MTIMFEILHNKKKKNPRFSDKQNKIKVFQAKPFLAVDISRTWGVASRNPSFSLKLGFWPISNTYEVSHLLKLYTSP